LQFVVAKAPGIGQARIPGMKVVIKIGIEIIGGQICFELPVVGVENVVDRKPQHSFAELFLNARI